MLLICGIDILLIPLWNISYQLRNIATAFTVIESFALYLLYTDTTVYDKTYSV